jgi:hypothetical protein
VNGPLGPGPLHSAIVVQCGSLPYSHRRNPLGVHADPSAGCDVGQTPPDASVEVSAEASGDPELSGVPPPSLDTETTAPLQPAIGSRVRKAATNG